jgi:myo-inositol-1-phosphate synthase|tara:strand:+ start:4977 stop:6044 length:1068 start_codon:yes stop_codon:yes gene_type:complete
MKKIKVSIVGVGNCASAIVQGVHYYKDKEANDSIGLTSYELGGYEPGDIEFVSAFDVDKNKVGEDLSQAIFRPPNNTHKITDVPHIGVNIQKGSVLDGIGKYVTQTVKIDNEQPKNIAKSIQDSGAEIVLNYLPVGSTAATKFYAEQSLRAGAAFINAMPVFIASDSYWQKKFTDAKLPVAGDDVMSQLGATVLHKTLVKLCVDRGVKVDETYQLNIGGDTDFLNMQEESRLADKRVSKTSAVKAMTPYEVPTRIGPSDFVKFLDNDKVCYIYLKGKYFGNTPVLIDVKLHVVDAFNSAGVMIDAIRGTKMALERGISGPLESISAYCFKHPPIQMSYNDAKQAFLKFVDGKNER